MTRFDLAVVGAGLMGSATAYAAARRGLSVALIEQYPLGHTRGSSHGSARIVRRAYADPMYVRMTGEALELWQDLQHNSGKQLLRILGGIDHGAHRDLPAIAQSLTECGVPFEHLDAGGAAERWPGMRFSTDVLHHTQAGTVDAAAAVDTMLDEARALGAHVRGASPVTRVDVSEDVVLHTDSGEVRARTLVCAAGSWTSDLLGGVVALPRLTVTQQQIFHFPRRDLGVVWPIAVHKDAMSTYSLPGGCDGGGGDARKVAEHNGGAVTTAATRDAIVDSTARRRIVDYVEQWLPGLVPQPFAEATCLYTSTDDEDFVIDRAGPVVVLSPCSGHGAKFAPLIGEMAVDLATGVRRAEPRFRLAR